MARRQRHGGAPHSKRGGFNPNQSRRVSINAYSSLGEQADGEYNSHISERFRSTVPQRRRDPQVPDDDVPEAGPLRSNGEVQKYFEVGTKHVAGAGPWLEKPEIPDPAEILREDRAGFSPTNIEALIPTEDEPRPKKIEGPYDNKEDYLRTEYELLREDALRPLSEAVAEVRKDPWKEEAKYEKNVGIYDPVYITSFVFSPRGLATRVAFSMSRVKKHIRWQQSKRLITGSLVALSPYDDAFKETCILAIVAARPVSALQQNPPEIDLFFPHHNQPIDSMQQWVMVECRNSFFEASRHTLTALQHMMRETFPLSEHLVDVKKDVDPPSYVQNDPFIDLSSLVSLEEASSYQNVNVLGEQEWPSNDATPLDASQSKALKDIITRRVAIVQGPPGTGKTFVSVKALQILVDNLRKHDAPIIVTAQTNHAVDQILRHTSSFVPKYARLGGRSKDPEIMKRTLFMLRSALPPRKSPQSLKTQAANAMRRATATCKKLLAPLEMGRGPLDHQYLERIGLLTKDQAESLEMDNDSILDKPQDAPGELMQQWLGKALTECRRPICPDDFGYEWEEEDLDIEQLQELEAEAFTPDDDDIEALKGEVFMLSDNYRGKGAGITDREIQEIMNTISDLTTIQFDQRGSIYNYLMRQLKKRLLIQVRKVAEGYHKAYHLRRVGLWDEDVSLLSKQRIIGMTTTGLSKYRALIAALRPRVVLVEEAAETMEAPVTAACLPTVEHLILVGDHQQLRPHTQVRKFEDTPFHLNLSLFERLVLNDIEYDQLNRQRRMIPEIRRLLRPIYEEDLKDHSSVKDVSNRPPVKGMGGLNTYFFTHEWPEARDANSSCYNDPEANFIVGFVDYLVLNGEDPLGITILTFYNGQRKRLIQRIRSHPNLRMYPFKVVTVDSYQGEENDIVLLSLVRQNRNHSIGFLSNDNRACVALSRAKRGFYLFGDAKLLACESWTWAEVVEIMYQTRVPKSRRKSGVERRIGYCLPLECVRHGRKSWVAYTDDWYHIYGGCDRPCGGTLTCDHPCPYPCHPFEHDLINCEMVCARKLDCGHVCEAACCDTCKCRICDQRANGQRPLLKSGPSGQRPSPLRNLLIDSGFQTPPNPPPTFSSPAKWDADVNSGAKADDAWLLAKRKEEDTAFEAARDGMVQNSRTGKLIETSPQKPRASISKNIELLLDLDLNDGNKDEVEPAKKARARYASAARSSDVQKEQSEMNFLD